MLIIQRISISDKNFRFRLNFCQKFILLRSGSQPIIMPCNALRIAKIQASSSSDS